MPNDEQLNDYDRRWADIYEECCRKDFERRVYKECEE